MARGRPYDYPGLQEKFEIAVSELLGREEGRKMSMPDILRAIRDNPDQYNLTAPEAVDLALNGANYFERAKRAGVLVGHGRRQGYTLGHAKLREADPDEVGQPVEEGPFEAYTPAKVLDLAIPSMALVEDGRALAGQKLQRESVFHLPATVALSYYFEALVSSLPTYLDWNKWSNPDMILVRDNALARVLARSTLSPDLFKQIHLVPNWILAAVELKYGLGADRTKLFTAIAECAGNSTWANESWLVLGDSGEAPIELDGEALRAAEGFGIGVGRVVVTPELGFQVIRQAKTRPNLQLGDQQVTDKAKLLAEVERVLRIYDAEGSLFDVESNEGKLATLLKLCSSNLAQQKGFSDLVKTQVSLDALQSDAGIREFVRATLDRLAGSITAGGTGPSANPIAALQDHLTVRDGHNLSELWTMLAKFSSWT